MQNWDDLRFLLAVHKTGTMSAAARLLNTNVATVSRRMDRLAQDLGAAPFVKTPSGWQPSHQAQVLLDAAETFEGELERERNTTGSIRPDSLPRLKLGAAPTIIAAVLLPRIGGVDKVPGPVGRIALEVVERMWETGLGNHDVVVQRGRPESGRITVRRVGSMRYRVYRWRDAPIDQGWITLTDPHEPFEPIAAAHELLPGPPILRFETYTQILIASRQLRLPAILPETLALGEPDLVPIDEPSEAHVADYWLMYHLSRRGDPAVQALADWVAACFRDAESCPRH